ncbi:hypothetical protein GCM10010917_20040 [Paenibacillus physcomitrellae]|uniref:Uncharacterized protein n=1 Tax=Paenibacillus physcomitrellae TaxID=1619311 RepID=A0ABQ1G046_9BACL|nr:hypothetical protein GCM10010917_20040 [Paenibacillus physcomitrellae]
MRYSTVLNDSSSQAKPSDPIVDRLNPVDNPASDKERNDVKRDSLNGNMESASPLK